MDKLDQTWLEMRKAANAVRHKRRISGYVDAGAVAAAVLSKSGHIYTGVCVDTCCTLGICAERSAIFQMITAGEDALTRVLAVGRKGRLMPPCGACRELIVQMMPSSYGSVEVLLGEDEARPVRLADLTPEWWIQQETKQQSKA